MPPTRLYDPDQPHRGLPPTPSAHDPHRSIYAQPWTFSPCLDCLEGAPISSSATATGTVDLVAEPCTGFLAWHWICLAILHCIRPQLPSLDLILTCRLASPLNLGLPHHHRLVWQSRLSADARYLCLVCPTQLSRGCGTDNRFPLLLLGSHSVRVIFLTGLEYLLARYTSLLMAQVAGIPRTKPTVLTAS